MYFPNLRFEIWQTLLVLFFVCISTHLTIAQNLPSARELLDKSIAYHDPQGEWFRAQHRLVLAQSRPDGKTDEITVVINNIDGLFQSIAKRDSVLIEMFVQGDSTQAKINGSTEISTELRTKYRLTPDRLKRMRNYYIYLYGLPMKLYDPGAHLDPTVTKTKFEGQEVYALKVTYDEAIGKDVWYFYFAPKNFALAGYRFYHDESKNDGEYIILQDEAVAGGMRLPKIRRWYTNNDNKYLGTDTIALFEQVGK